MCIRESFVYHIVDKQLSLTDGVSRNLLLLKIHIYLR